MEDPGMAATSASPQVAAGGEGICKGRVLLVDDDTFIQEATGTILQVLGHNPMVVGSGEEALVALSGGLCPALVILDLDMPGMGGLRALRLMREQWPSLPIVISTGRTDPTVAALTRDDPNVGFLPKPYNLAQLKAHL